jgi:hypothetical protein
MVLGWDAAGNNECPAPAAANAPTATAAITTRPRSAEVGGRNRRPVG